MARVQWILSDALDTWVRECSRISGVPCQRLAERIFRYYLGHLPEDEAAACEHFLATVGESVADGLDWDDGEGE
jgi:hypothetical protein